MSRLYELVGEWEYLYNLLSQGEIDEQVMADSLEGMGWEENLEENAEYCGRTIRSFEADAAAAKSESDRLSKRAKTFENAAKRAKDRLHEAMVSMNLDKIKTPLFGFSIANNAVSVSISDDAVIPEGYMRITSSPDKTAIKEALQNGEVISGCTLVQSQSLRMR